MLYNIYNFLIQLITLNNSAKKKKTHYSKFLNPNEGKVKSESPNVRGEMGKFCLGMVELITLMKAKSKLNLPTLFFF